MGPSSREAHRLKSGRNWHLTCPAILQAATRVLAGVALRSLDVLDGALALQQFRMRAAIADVGRARSVLVAWAPGPGASAVTRLADRIVAAGYLSRSGEPGHRCAVALELTPSGKDLAGRRVQVTRGLRQLSGGRRRGLPDDLPRPDARVTASSRLARRAAPAASGPV